MRNKLFFFLTIFVLSACCSFTNDSYCFGQSTEKLKSKTVGAILKKPVERKTEDDFIRVETSLIINDIMVFDSRGNPVKNLTKENFIVSEDGRQQEIISFAFGDSETIPRSIVLIIDYSSSQLPYINTSIEAAQILVDKLNPSDRMAIVTDNVELIQDFTSDKVLLKEKLASLKADVSLLKFGQSRQYSALMAVLNEMFDEENLRPIIIFQTDGDELSQLKKERLYDTPRNSERVNFSYDDILTAIEKKRSTIYSIIPGLRFTEIPRDEQLKRSRMALVLGEEAFYKLRKKDFKPDELKLSETYIRSTANMFDRQQSALSQIAQFTGGQTKYLEQPEQASEVYSEILSEMNLRYLLGYYPINQTRDGRRRNVEIKVPEHPEYKIWARKSYILVEK